MKKPARRLPYVPALTDTRILSFVSTYDILTALQIAKLLGYNLTTSLHDVQRRLKLLTEYKYLQYIPFTYRRDRTKTRGGTAPLLYSLTGKGQSHLRSAGFTTNRRLHVTEQRQRQQQSLKHSLLVNEVLIAAQRLDRLKLGATLVDKRHEHELKLLFPGGAQPDCWLHFWLPDVPLRACLALELDRGTEDEAQIKDKLKRLIAWSYEPYKNIFHTEILQIVFLTVTGEARRNELKTWAEEYLTRSNQTAEADLFLFCSANPETITPYDLFFQPLWYYPFQDLALPLLAQHDLPEIVSPANDKNSEVIGLEVQAL